MTPMTPEQTELVATFLYGLAIGILITALIIL
jgi:hypothetical protein